VSFIIGRGRADVGEKPAGYLGRFRALDGSDGAPLYLDCNRPHAMVIVGKRGYGKSYTLGVIAEELARIEGVAPVVLDPMAAFATVAGGTDVPARVVSEPAVRPDSLDGRSWCALVGLSPESAAGALLWQAADRAGTLPEIRDGIQSSTATDAAKRAAINHVDLADSWGVFDADGLDVTTLTGGELTVLDLSGLDDGPMNAVARSVADTLYHARVDDTVARLPWLLADEAHTFFDGVAAPALETVLTRGRAPGVSSVFVTQRPAALPEVAISQSDILVSHRLTAESDTAALSAAQPTYMTESLESRLPTAPGEVLIVDDSTETVHTAGIRTRITDHGGESATVCDRAEPELSGSNINNDT